jgi:ribonucleoside-diphosphate reductase alpha chain
MLEHYNSTTVYGPATEVAQQLHAEKYRGLNESFYDCMSRISGALADDDNHRRAFKGALLNQRFMPGGRIQSSVGAPRETTAFNCFVSGTILDSMDSIMGRATDASEIMRMGGGNGYDFSRLRPRGDRIVSLDSSSSGPVSFMGIYDAVCATISSSGHRRGAQMGVLRVDHPDIEEFVRAKQNDNQLTCFNVSVGVTDEFMMAVEQDGSFDLRFGGKVYSTISARNLWDDIMRSTWEWAEPGVLFLDTINRENNLNYCETIEATNPCGEQPLPPFGACLLGSFNLAKYVGKEDDAWGFDWEQFETDIPHVVRAMDNVIDSTTYPLPEHEKEAKAKRRMGLGVTGLANASEALGMPYGSSDSIIWIKTVMTTLRDNSYIASVELAKEKGQFPMFTLGYLNSPFIKRLPDHIQRDIETYGIRNSHLISIAPAGTISLCADNTSSGIEPTFAVSVERRIETAVGQVTETIMDYGVEQFNTKPLCADELSVQSHLNVLLTVQPYVDSACSKTCNVGEDVEWEDFKAIYMDAWKGGAKGITTFRNSGKRYGVMKKAAGEACYIDPETGQKECS